MLVMDTNLLWTYFDIGLILYINTMKKKLRKESCVDHFYMATGHMNTSKLVNTGDADKNSLVCN